MTFVRSSAQLVAARLASVVLTLAVVSGCGWGDPLGFVPVEGRVTFDGQPLEIGEIRFCPDASEGNKGPMSIGVLGLGGSFKLKGPGARIGAAPGPHKVCLVSPFSAVPEQPILIEGKVVMREELAGIDKSADPPAKKWNVPKKFLDVETSGLTAHVVPKKRNTVDFEITSSVKK